MKTLMTAVLLLVCGAVFAQSSQSPDEKAIRDIDKQWAAAAMSKDAARTASFYADDASMFPPGAPVANGKQAIAAVWKQFLSDPNIVSVNFGPNKVEIAKSGDMAYDTGWTEIKLKNGEVEKGKYVVVWKKTGGKWKPVADIFNNDK